MSDLLARMATLSARRAAQARGREREATLLRRAADTPPAPPLALHADGFDLFAEIKRRAPSAGRRGASHEDDAAFAASRARAYAGAGAAVISVLTEPEAFGGRLDDLRAAARSAPVPAMRKDFLVDPYQAAEARAAGAGGILLIRRLLNRARLSEMLDAAGALGLWVLLESFDEADLDGLGEAGEEARRRGVLLLAGLNTRDLATLQVDGTRLARLAGRLPAGLTRVAESGFLSAAAVRAAAALGYQAALVGRALMNAADPGAVVRDFVAAGREGAKARCASA